jgi:hypothetical protein
MVIYLVVSGGQDLEYWVLMKELWLISDYFTGGYQATTTVA